MSVRICPFGQRPWWPELFTLSFVRRAQPGAVGLAEGKKPAELHEVTAVRYSSGSRLSRPLCVSSVCLWHHCRVLLRGLYVYFLFSRFAVWPCSCIFADLAQFDANVLQPRVLSVPLASLGDLVSPRPQVVVCSFLHQAPPDEQGQLICRCSGVAWRIQGSSRCVAIQRVSHQRFLNGIISLLWTIGFFFAVSRH